jgi:hypothetical protein
VGRKVNVDQPQIRSRKTYVAMLMLSHKRLKSREVNLSVFTMDARRKLKGKFKMNLRIRDFNMIKI